MTRSSIRGRVAHAPGEALARAASRRLPAARDEVFRALVENTPDLIARFDRDLRRCYVNPAIERFTGVPARRLVGKTLAELHFDARFSGPLEAALTAALREGKETTLEVRLPSATEERVFQARVVPERDAAGQVVFAMVISRDISDVRRDEERLRALKREIEMLLTSTYEGIFAMTPSGTCTFVNPSGASMLGYEPEELIERNMHELLHAGRGDHGPEDCRLTGGTVGDSREHLVDETFRRKDGTGVEVDVFVSPLLDEEGRKRGVVVSFVDITERNALKAELELANRLAGLGRVASAMSHEFNNVLMGIQPFAEIVARTSAEARTLDAAKRILQSVRRGRAITEGMRAYTRPPAPVRVETEIGAWLAGLADELRRLVPQAVHLEVRIPDSAVLAVIDSGQMTQVLSSLVVNASEAIGQGEGRIVVEASIASHPEGGAAGGAVRLTVRDDGPGMANEDLSKIFEPFFSTRPGGRGLGLSIAQQVVSRHEGQIEVTSAPGEGTSVDILLPARMARAGSPQPAAAAEQRLPRTVLLVEDDETVAGGILMLLEDEGVEAELAGSGAEALRSIESRPPQALVLDINLPDCDGFELYERIAAERGRLPVVFISGHADEIMLKRGATAAGVRLLSKPFEVKALLDALTAVVSNPPQS